MLLLILLLSCSDTDTTNSLDDVQRGAHAWLGNGSGRLLGCYKPIDWKSFYLCEVETEKKEHVVLHCDPGCVKAE